MEKDVQNAVTSQLFLQLVKRLYDKRDEVVESSQELMEYAYGLEDCRDSELKDMLLLIRKEMNRIISDVYELAPHLKNPGIVASISEQARIISIQMERLEGNPDSLTPVFKRQIGTSLRITTAKMQIRRKSNLPLRALSKPTGLKSAYTI